MNLKAITSLITFTCLFACSTPSPVVETNQLLDNPWDGATIYFLMTDRFYDGNIENNFQHTADNPPAPHRGFTGGDIQGITAKIKEGYFQKLGVDAIWFSPVVEQIKSSVDEGTGNSFGYHGYWTRDWTALDPTFGSKANLQELVKVAHQNGLKVLIDVVANHTGPATPLDSQWPDEWVKTGPRCTYISAETTIDCTLVDNLPDIRTESDIAVELPVFLIEKWKTEGRYEREIEELDAWFAKTKYPRSPVHYVLKWLVDFIKEYGVDGYRVDTVKHTEAYVWSDLYKAASVAFGDYKKQHPQEFPDDAPFYMVGEVYNYYANVGRDFDYGDQKVDFFDHGFHSLINFDFKTDANGSYESIFTKYDTLLRTKFKGKDVVSYISSHDDSGPFDKERKRAIESGSKLLLSPGGIQIYYGDESARALDVIADGDAVLRSPMNWDDIASDAPKKGYSTRQVLDHWRKLGSFRKANPAIKKGRHKMISASPYLFSRSLAGNEVIVGLELSKGAKLIDVSTIFSDGDQLLDAYSGNRVTVHEGTVQLDTPYEFVLLSK